MFILANRNFQRAMRLVLMNWQKIVGYWFIFVSFSIILFFVNKNLFWDGRMFWFALGFGIIGAALIAWGDMKDV